MPPMRRRLYLMRHGAVSYFVDDGRPAQPDDVALNEEGRAQAEAARALLDPVRFDRVLTSGMVRAVQTAEIVARNHEGALEDWPELRELRGDRLASIPPDDLEREFVARVPRSRAERQALSRRRDDRRALRPGPPRLERLLADTGWDTALAVLHGG